MVVLFDRIGHVFRLAVMARVVRAHDALQLGEFAHHQCAQVGFCQVRGAADVRLIDTERLGDLDCNACHALDALKLRSELVVIDHIGQSFDARFECLLAILVVEELGVRQPCPHHARIAFDDCGWIIGLEVRHQQETVEQLPMDILQREILLILLHGQDQALVRHGEKLAVEAGLQHDRPLDERGHLVEQRLRHERMRVDCGRRLAQQVDDARAAPLERCDDLAFAFQLFGVGICRMHDDLALRQKAMPERLGATDQAEHLHRKRRMSMQRDQTMRWPRKLHRGHAVGQLIAHDLGDRQLLNGLVQCRLQCDQQRLPRRDAIQEHGLCLAIALD